MSKIIDWGKIVIQKIRPNIHCVQIPLPDTPLKYLNSYIIQSTERNLIIDTGFNHPDCLAAMHAALRELDVALDKTDFFITHLHADHFALVPELATQTSNVYFNRLDAEIIESWDGFEPMLNYASLHGFPRELLRPAFDQHPGNKFGSSWFPTIRIIHDGEILPVGEYRLQCKHTPGHTLGHICLYETKTRLLFAGDHLLTDITPNIQCWSDDHNPLQQYLESLVNISRMNISLVLPGHRRFIPDHRQRAKELMAHHEVRLDEVLKIVAGAPKNAYQTASRMGWDIKAESWNDFPLPQQLFATTEAIAHLRYLEEKGNVARKTVDNIVQFFRVE
jgi:glyoxylase-like metal-dependent hydrolase (beta-lactamase superfamily II)